MSTKNVRKRVVLAGLVGNVMEWYDFAVYGYFASVIGRQFFPSDNPTVSLVGAFGAFAAGFLVRPLGGLLFGRLGDLVGRKHTLTLSVLAMAVPTVLIAFLPTYAQAGLFAPVAIVFLRIVQGLSVGGEYTSSLVFLVEHADSRRRAFTGVWGMWGASVGVLLGSGIGSLVANSLSEEQVVTWGWRLPFLLGSLVALTGYLVRRSIHADPPPAPCPSPVRDTFGKHRASVIRVALLNVGNGVGFYAAFVYAVTYIKEIDGLSEGLALNLNTASMALLLVVLPTAAWFSDRLGRKPLIIAGSILLTLGSWPLFHLIHGTNPMLIFLGEIGFVVAVGLVAGGLVAANVELMPGEVRCTGLAFAYNASIGYFGGTTPMIAAWLIAWTGYPLIPAFWVSATALITLVTALFWTRETYRESLSPDEWGRAEAGSSRSR